MSKAEPTKDSSPYRVSSQSPRRVTFTMPTVPKFNRAPVGRWRYGLLAVGFLLVAILGGAAGAWLENHHTSTVTASLSDQKKIVSSQSRLVSQIAKTVGPSVVSVDVNIASSSSSSDNPYTQLFGGSNSSQSEAAAGTGIIISPTVIMTNRHVVPAGTTKVSVTLSDGTELRDVSVIGRTNDNDNLDIAFLKVNNTEGHTLKAATIGNSSQVQVGDDVVAIGNALGQFQNTVTSGIISGYGRSVQAGDSGDNSGASDENLDDLFQTDAAINEGNSGGPLTNLNGQVIGINTAVASDSQNIGFAIPINDVSGLIDQVLKSGKFARPYLGVRYIPLTKDVAQSYDLKTNNGAFVAPTNDPNTPAVLPDSPAAKAGIQEKDIITAVNGTKIDQAHSLSSLLSKRQPGDTVKLTILRNGKTTSTTATIGTLPTTDTSTSSNSSDQ